MGDIFSEVMQKLMAAGVESPRLETRLLIAAAAEIESAQVFSDIVLNEAQTVKLRNMTAQRTAHKPLDKILGHRAFYKADFAVNNSVLSPRPDTEVLVEKALQYMPQNAYNILDLGTGSGCIIESILLEKPSLRGAAVDISTDALKTARKNAEKLELDGRLDFICADWFATDFLVRIGQKFDVIVSNPPYIPTADIATLAPEVKDYDPMQALDGGADGYVSYRRIAELTPELLSSGGYILLEAGIGQAQTIADVFEQKGLKLIEIADDLNGIARCVILQKTSD